MIDKVTSRLDSLGYTVTEDDSYNLQYSIDCTEQYIKTYCNLTQVPDTLECAWTDIAASNFLSGKYSSGQLSGMQIEQVVKKVQDGDALVEYATDADRETTFVKYMDRMKAGHASELIAHRKMRW